MTQLLKDILQKNSAFRNVNAVLLWDEIVDSKIQKHTKALKLQKGVLYVIVESPAWAQELNYFKKEIAIKINNRAGDEVVKDIRFKVGEVKE